MAGSWTHARAHLATLHRHRPNDHAALERARHDFRVARACHRVDQALDGLSPGERTLVLADFVTDPAART